MSISSSEHQRIRIDNLLSLLAHCTLDGHVRIRSNTPLERDRVCVSYAEHADRIAMPLAEQSFCQDIRGLKLRSDVRQRDVTIRDVIADEMIANADVLGEIVMARILRQLDGAFVVDS